MRTPPFVAILVCSSAGNETIPGLVARGKTTALKTVDYDFHLNKMTCVRPSKFMTSADPVDLTRQVCAKTI